MSTLTQSKPAVRKGTIIKWIVSILIPVVIMLFPTTTSFTPTVRNFLAVTFFFIAMIATELIPMAATAIILPVVYIVVFQIPSELAFKSWSLEVPWMILCGFLVSNALVKTGLMKRMAYLCVLAMGGKFTGIIYGFMILGTILSLIISDPVAKCTLLATLAVSMCNILKLKMGGKSASAIGLCVYVAMLNPGFFFYHGSNNNLVPMNVVAGMGLEVPSWGAYFVHMFVPQLIFTLLCCFAIQFLFRPDEKIETKDFLRSELAQMGRMTRDEKKMTIIFLLMVVAIALNGVHHIAVGWIFVIATFVMLLPGVKLVEPADFKAVNLPMVFFVASCLTIGIVSSALGVGQFLADLVQPLLEGSLYRSFAGVWVFGFLANFILTPLAAYSAFTAPVATMAQNLGINFLPMVYTFTQSLEQVVLPYEFAPILMLFGYGMISKKNIVTFSVIKSAISIVCILAVYMTWWKLIGLL